jgi:hypothetical protein
VNHHVSLKSKTSVIIIAKKIYTFIVPIHTSLLWVQRKGSSTMKIEPMFTSNVLNGFQIIMIKFMHFIQWNIWIELNWIELNWKYNSSFIYQMQCTSKISIPIYGWYYKKYLMVITMISVKKCSPSITNKIIVFSFSIRQVGSISV